MRPPGLRPQVVIVVIVFGVFPVCILLGDVLVLGWGHRQRLTLQPGGTGTGPRRGGQRFGFGGFGFGGQRHRVGLRCPRVRRWFGCLSHRGYSPSVSFSTELRYRSQYCPLLTFEAPANSYEDRSGRRSPT